MRKYAAALAVAALMAAAFFLPEWLSTFHDQQLLDNPSIQTQNAEQEGFAETIQLTVAEKLMLLRSGSLTAMELGRDVVEGISVNIAGNYDIEVGVYSAGGDLEKEASAELKTAAEEEIAAYNEEMNQLWEPRMAAVQTEVRNLQALGGLPMLWSGDSEISCTAYGEWMYMDPDTRINFQVYRVTLSCEAYDLELTVDVQSGRIFSFILRWGADGAPSWGIQGAANFGAAWRNYWGMDSVGGNWYDSYNRSILEQAQTPAAINGDYSALSQIFFTYDGQSIPVPLECRARTGWTSVILWNC